MSQTEWKEIENQELKQWQIHPKALQVLNLSIQHSFCATPQIWLYLRLCLEFILGLQAERKQNRLRRKGVAHLIYSSTHLASFWGMCFLDTPGVSDITTINQRELILANHFLSLIIQRRHCCIGLRNPLSGGSGMWTLYPILQIKSDTESPVPLLIRVWSTCFLRPSSSFFHISASQLNDAQTDRVRKHKGLCSLTVSKHRYTSCS